ncbi:iron chelate uptake ABC transporter family permease subunit [Pontibacter sp. G13]|uniref:metal ABC transporter permease n=1 Tax=Pontibacter sp. G13 TaxID=3074898 RepID=UPI00288A6DF2|nr:metal ABC transporter permease [Pontibacter sp. G13]WNJ18853.1 iron chelate uptake ABC transporter family permease subunit [Pontibacter sp. G13]
MEQLIDIFSYDFAVRAFWTSAMVGITCGVLGCFIFLKNMSLIGDALSHAILPGVVGGFMVSGGASLVGLFTGSVLAGLIAAVLITWIQRNVQTREDAAIGIVFTSMFAIGIMGISWLTRQEGVHLDMRDFLFGNVLGISDSDIWMTLCIMLFTLVAIGVFFRYFFITTFHPVMSQAMGISAGTMHYFLMLLISLAVVASLQSVGVILVVAMLITPASTAFLLTKRLSIMLVISAIVGLASTTIGFLVAVIYETTPGPAMTVVASLFFLLAVLLSPSKGLLWRSLRRKRAQNRVLQEDILKHAVSLAEHGNLELKALKQAVGASELSFQRGLNALKRKQEIISKSGKISLTSKGTKIGYDLIRAHRLWEAYLVKEVGLSSDQIHNPAEDVEHIIPAHLVEKVAQHLGHPERDPHGSIIPPVQGTVSPNIFDLAVGDRAFVYGTQAHPLAASLLWNQHIEPETRFELLKKEKAFAEISFDGKKIQIEKAIAENIRIYRHQRHSHTNETHQADD